MWAVAEAVQAERAVSLVEAGTGRGGVRHQPEQELESSL